MSLNKNCKIKEVKETYIVHGSITDNELISILADLIREKDKIKEINVNPDEISIIYFELND